MVPLTYSYTGQDVNAHYYLYHWGTLISDKPLTENTTLANLPEGSYNLLVYVTTEFGQDSKPIPFFVVGTATFMVAVVLLFILVVGLLVRFKKLNLKKHAAPKS